MSEVENRQNDSEKRCKALDIERHQLQSDYDDASDNLQTEVAKYQSMQAQLEKQKLDFEKRLAAKEHELDVLRYASVFCLQPSKY